MKVVEGWMGGGLDCDGLRLFSPFFAYAWSYESSDLVAFFFHRVFVCVVCRVCPGVLPVAGSRKRGERE